MDNNTDSLSQPAKPAKLLGLLLLGFVLFVGLLSLGVWQVQRLQWKLALIDRIEQRVHAAPKPAPGPADWSAINRAANEYSRIQVAGRFDHGRETLVRASTELGRGFWLLTPLQTSTGFWVLINRGFVPEADGMQSRAQILRPDNSTLQTITGLLRLSEPAGSWLQHNDAAAGRWYSRDVQAIAASVKLVSSATSSNSSTAAAVAPYFIDAAASAETANSAVWPRAGLTVLSFNNHHLVYAITWFVLAAMVAAAATYLRHSERQLRALAARGQSVPNCD
jgi:surfeit locus 1 family protein